MRRGNVGLATVPATHAVAITPTPARPASRNQAGLSEESADKSKPVMAESFHSWFVAFHDGTNNEGRRLARRMFCLVGGCPWLGGADRLRRGRVYGWTSLAIGAACGRVAIFPEVTVSVYGVEAHTAWG